MSKGDDVDYLLLGCSAPTIANELTDAKVCMTASYVAYCLEQCPGLAKLSRRKLAVIRRTFGSC